MFNPDQLEGAFDPFNISNSSDNQDDGEGSNEPRKFLFPLMLGKSSKTQRTLTSRK